MKKIVVYGNGGSGNHGNEAILRGLQKLMGNEAMTVFSYNKEIDKRWGIDEIYEVKNQRTSLDGFTLEHIRSYIFRHLKLDKAEVRCRFRSFTNTISHNAIYLLEAGDQYCEPIENKIRSYYEYLNREICKKKSKSVMLFCSIPAESLNEQVLIDDLNNYSLIIAREKITYNALMSKHLSTKVIFSPCCAFVMEPKKIELPKIYRDNNVVGITVGELAQNKEDYNKNLYQRMKELIEFILMNSNYNVALIPHVHGGIPDDVRFSDLLEQFFDNPRVVNVGEHRADEQKFAISKCTMMITVRTHVSVAAYSTFVPTIVVGYSQKSIGIARDLFGADEHYVINIEDACKEHILVKEFQWLEKHKDEIKLHLKDKLPNYLACLEDAKKEIEKLKYE